MNTNEQPQVLKVERGPSMFKLIAMIADKGQAFFDYDERNYVRTIISGKVKDKYPDRKYETEKSGDLLIVKRDDSKVN